MKPPGTHHALCTRTATCPLAQKSEEFSAQTHGEVKQYQLLITKVFLCLQGAATQTEVSAGMLEVSSLPITPVI